ncbi:MAG: NAD(P)-dependent oxidoreductase [Bacteriovoracaceae bacterium]|nr:NAD(P)-dependent oxidoreductase [Bacteriovoracaceae bacterium]
MVRDPENTEIVITGANGLVGFEVLKEFSSNWPEFEIKAFVRSEPHFILPNVSYIKGSLPNEIPTKLFEKENVILIHFASQLKAESLEDYQNINVTGTSKLLDMAGDKLSLIFYGSSMSVYGQGPFEGVAEENEVNPETELAKTRREAEILVEMKCKELGIPAFLLRPRFILGKRDRSTLPSLLKLSNKGFRIGNENQRFSFIDVEDYARIISSLASQTKIGGCEALNIGYEQPVSLKQMLDLMNEKRESNSFSLPIGLIMGICGYVKKLKPVKVKLELIGQSQVLDVSKLRGNLKDLMSDWNSEKKIKKIIEEFIGAVGEVEN